MSVGRRCNGDTRRESSRICRLVGECCIAASVGTSRLPGEMLASGGADVRDVTARDGAGAVRTAIDNARPFKPSVGMTDERPEVLITFNEAAVAEQVLHHLSRLGWETPWLKADKAERSRVIERGGVLVHVVNDRTCEQSVVRLSESVRQIRELPMSLVRERITQAVRLVEEVKTGEEIQLVPKRPVDWLVLSIQQRGEFGGKVRPPAGVIRTP